jgi:hypothetical protein
MRATSTMLVVVGCVVVLTLGGVTRTTSTSGALVLLASEPYVSQPCGALGPHPGTESIPPPSQVNDTSRSFVNYTTNVTILWDKLCINATFVAIIMQWGGWHTAWTGGSNNTSYPAADNLTSGAVGPGNPPIIPIWDIEWLAACDNASLGPICYHSVQWSGNVSTENLSGPVIYEWSPCAANCGSSGPGSAEGVATQNGSAAFPGAPIAVAGLIVGAIVLLLSRRMR